METMFNVVYAMDSVLQMFDPVYTFTPALFL